MESRKKRANKTRTILLKFINKEALNILKNPLQMKINHQTPKEILSKYDLIEVKINHPIITGTPIHSGHIKTLKKYNSINNLMEEEYDDFTAGNEINLFLSLIHEKKVLFSKNKLKNVSGSSHSNSRSNSSKKSNSGYNEFSKEAFSVRAKKTKKRIEGYDKVKNSLILLRKIVYKIKRKEVQIKERGNNRNLTSNKLITKGENGSPHFKEETHLHKKTPHDSGRKIVRQQTMKPSDYDFKINLHKVSGDNTEKPKKVKSHHSEGTNCKNLDPSQSVKLFVPKFRMKTSFKRKHFETDQLSFIKANETSRSTKEKTVIYGSSKKMIERYNKIFHQRNESSDSD